MRWNKRKAFPCLLALLAPVVVSAQTDGADTLHALRGVEVVGVRLAQREVIGGQRLDGDALRRLDGGSVADALRYFAGVQLKDYDGVGGIKTVNIRSMGSQHVGVYYDGVELGNAQNGQVDLGQFSLDNVQELTVYAGQRSSIFQSASDFAHGGTVYLRTRRPRFADGKRTNLKARVEYGSSDLLRLSSLWEEKLSDRVSLSLSMGWTSASGKYRFRYRRVTPDGSVAYDTMATRHNGDIRAERVELNVNGQLQRGFWSGKAYFYDSGRGIPGAIVNNVWRRGERQYDTNVFLQQRFQKDFGDRFSTQWLAKYAYYRTRYIDRDTTHLPVDNRYWQQEVYLSTSNVYELLPCWSVSASYDLRWNKLNADTYRFVFPTRLTQLAAVATALDFGALRLQGSLVGSFVSDHVRRGASARLHRYMPAFHVCYYPLVSHTLSLHAFAKRSFRMPTFNDLYYAEVGNAALRPESTNQYDVGWTYDGTASAGWLQTYQVRMDGYYNTVHDKIIAYPKGQQFRWTMLNLGRVHIVGVDAQAAATFRPLRDLTATLRLQYTWQQARDVTSSSTPYYKDQIPYIPLHSGSAVVSLQYKRWGLDYSFIYAGERWSGQENTATNHLEPWYTHDVALRCDFAIGRSRCRASLELNNVLNQQYEVILNYPMPGTNGRIGLEMTL